MPIECNQINQTINYLRSTFQDCSRVSPEDLRLLVDLVAAIYNCESVGTNYSTVNNDVYEPIIDTTVTYPIDSFHAVSIVIASGMVIYNGISLPVGTSINLEFTTLNSTAISFLAKAGSKVLVEYITETL